MKIILAIILMVIVLVCNSEQNKDEYEKPMKNNEVCLSCGQMVTADVRGALGPPTVLTKKRSDNMNWIHDRWQCASTLG